MGLAICYSIAFATLKNPDVLLAPTATLLTLAISQFHTPRDLAFVWYMIVRGAAVEYPGVGSGQWRYPNAPLGGIPLWFIAHWGGASLFIYGLILPLISPQPANVTT